MIMNVQITARHFELTDGIKEALNKRLEKLEKLVKESSRIHVVMEASKHGQKIELMIHLNEHFVKSEETDNDLYTAIDLATDKLVQKIHKLDRKKADRSHESIKYSLDVPSFEEEDYDDDEEPERITKRKTFNMKPMMEEEAVLQMEMLGHETFMFFNAESNSMCLLYKRKHGDFGIIESNY